MNITQNLCSNALRKAALLITKASDLGMDISGEGEAAENQNAGAVYLWLEDYPFTLYIGLGGVDTVYALWSSYECEREEEIKTTGETLHSLTASAEALSDAEVTE
jgi:hypothetical protein